MKNSVSQQIKPITVIILLFLLVPLYSQSSRSIPVIKFHEFEPIIHYKNDTTYVINFWATWCVPCRKELPYFERIHQEYANQKVKVLMVSLDFPSKMETSLIPFLNKHNITAKVLLLNDPNSSAWIDKVDPLWSGALPATLIYNHTERRFFEQELDYDTIKNTIYEINNP